VRRPNQSDNRANRRLGPSLGALLAVAGALSLDGALASDAETLRFRVYLDRDPIGEHSFRISPGASGQQVLSRASFDVDILFFNAYRYRHESRELWRDGCLEHIRASTDDNGKSFRVEGKRRADALALEVNGDAQRLAGCIGSFAYWDPKLLSQSRLLNPQTGELVSARLEPLGSAQRVLRGREVTTRGYRLIADRRVISLWYAEDGAWIGLESDTGKGRTLRYERI
jgi:hypothetical protein